MVPFAQKCPYHSARTAEHFLENHSPVEISHPIYPPDLMPAHFFFVPSSENSPQMMMITGHQEHEEGYNCQMKYSSFGCFQWLCTTAFRKT